MKLIFASNNRHKVKEIRSILGNNFDLLSLNDINIDEDIPEDEPSLEGNALAKARYINKLLRIDVFADDTGLEIDALDGLPGVHSARFAGDSKDPDANIEKVFALLGDTVNRKARFRTVIALILKNEEHLFEGIVDGTINSYKRGTRGFGYDPVFIPEGKKQTFAEMEPEEKNSISHRAKAIEKLKDFLDKQSQLYNK